MKVVYSRIAVLIHSFIIVQCHCLFMYAHVLFLLNVYNHIETQLQG